MERAFEVLPLGDDFAECELYDANPQLSNRHAHVGALRSHLAARGAPVAARPSPVKRKREFTWAPSGRRIGGVRGDAASAGGGGAAGWAVAAVVGSTIALVLHEGPLTAPRRPGANVADVKSLVRDRYVKELDDRTLEYGALRGIAASLDPYSAFFPPEDASDFRDDTDGELSGIGIEITIERGFVTVIAPLEGSPAWEAKLLPGDRIIEFDGQPREVATVDEAARLIRGKPGTKVRLTIVHEGATRPEEVEIERRRITVPSVKRPRMVDAARGIGYVRATQFSPTTDAEIHDAVKGLVARGARGIVLDLRSNPGGILEAALGTVALFVPEGEILRTLARDPAESRVYHAADYTQDRAVPSTLALAVLVNGSSASASEIVSAALQEAGRAVIVGTRSYGKGSVQSIIPLAGDARGEAILKLTTARFVTAKGRPIQRDQDAKDEDAWGVRPDIVVPLDARRLQDVFRRRDALSAREAGAVPASGAPGDAATAPSATAAQEPLPDPQLDAAVEALLARLSASGPGAK